MVNDHAIARDYPLPSGWRVRCRCGVTVRGIDEADAMTRFYEHAEADHLDCVEPEGAA